MHLLVTAGGLTADGAAWIRPAHPRFLLPGYVLSRLFRAKMRDALTHAGVGAGIDAGVWQRRWTVHVERIGTGDHATLYLSRYVYRVALTNQRLERFAEGRVTFQYTHARTHTTRSLTLPADDFLTRFCTTSCRADSPRSGGTACSVPVGGPSSNGRAIC